MLNVAQGTEEGGERRKSRGGRSGSIQTERRQEVEKTMKDGETQMEEEERRIKQYSCGLLRRVREIRAHEREEEEDEERKRGGGRRR